MLLLLSRSIQFSHCTEALPFISALLFVSSVGIVSGMAQAQPNPQVNAMCANIAAKLYPLGINAVPNVQVAYEEVYQITNILGELNHGVKRNDFGFPGSAQGFCILCKMAVLFVRRKVLIARLGLGAVQDPVFPPDFKHWIF